MIVEMDEIDLGKEVWMRSARCLMGLVEGWSNGEPSRDFSSFRLFFRGILSG